MNYAPITPIKVSGINMGALLGTTGTRELVQSINDGLSGSGFFGSVHDTFRDIRNSFVNSVIMPLQQTAAAVKNLVTTLMNPDQIRPLVEVEDFKTIPPCMYEAIVMYQPVKKLLEQGRISGFGFDPEFLPKEDVWGRLLENGYINDVAAARDKEGYVEFVWNIDSDDPHATMEELDAVERTREAIDRLLADTRYDPTDITEERG